jgi:conjugal transfer pilus assembly protein TraW
MAQMVRDSLTILLQGLMLGMVSMMIFAQVTKAKDFGVWGANFPIKEQALIDMLQQRAAQLDIQRLQQQMTNQASASVERPITAISLTKATKYKSFVFDPSYIVSEDVILPCGKILYPKGTSVNPFDWMQLSKQLIFLDGDDQEQVNWLVQQLAKGGSEQDITAKFKIILVSGSPWLLQSQLNQPVYFDQHSELVKRFGIAHVPAIVSQEERNLRIEEIAIN